MVRKLSLLFVTIFLSVAYSFSQNGTGEITGFVFDAINKSEGVFDAKIIVKSGTETKYIGKTDFNGTAYQEFNLDHMTFLLRKI